MDKNIDFFSLSFIFESSLFTKHWTSIGKMKGHKVRQKQVSSGITLFLFYMNLVDTWVLYIMFLSEKVDCLSGTFELRLFTFVSYCCLMDAELL